MRDISQLERTNYDLVVIGGGINGAAVAWDAALRGLKVALLEKKDFSSGASQGCFKIVHGGLRYLQHLELARLRESVAEQQTIRRIAPHLVGPLPFLVPCYGRGIRSKFVLNMGLSCYERLAAKRNCGVTDYHVLHNHKVISPELCLKIAPGLKRDGLTGGIIYFDVLMSDCERLTLAVVRAAVSAGADVFNYFQATRLNSRKNKDRIAEINSVTARDVLGRDEVNIRTKFVVNTAGPWLRLVQELISEDEEAVNVRHQPKMVFLKGIQVVVPQMISRYAVAVESHHSDPDALVSRGGRSYFFIPWRGRTMIGTADEFHFGDPDEYSISKNEVETLVKEVGSMYGARSLSVSNVLHAFGGLRPVDAGTARKMQRGEKLELCDSTVARRDIIVDHADLNEKNTTSLGVRRMPIANLITVEGVKYTTFRALAKKVVDKLATRTIFKFCQGCSTESTPLAGGDIEDYGEYLKAQLALLVEQFPQDVFRHLFSSYGSELPQLIALTAERAELAERLSPEREVIGAQVVYALRHEMAQNLSDVVMRRTGLGTLGNPGEETLTKAAQLMASELGWSNERVRDEVEEVLAAFERKISPTATTKNRGK